MAPAFASKVGERLGRQGEAGPPDGEDNPSSPLAGHYGDESLATIVPPVSSIIHNCHPGSGVALGSGRNYYQGPAFRGFHLQLSLNTIKPLLYI